MRLSATETERVVHWLTHLDLYADQVLGLKSGITLKDCPTELRNKVRVQWYEQPKVLESYIEDNPDRLSQEDLEVLKSWRGLERQRYMVVKCLKSGAILVHQKHYQVLGWNDSLEDLLYGEALPTMVETTLLPIGDKITYDGILLRFNIHFGSGSRKNMNEEYSYARRHGQILTSLAPPPTTVQPISPTACEHRPAVQAIQQTTEKLRGGGTRPLHSPALALLRWSAQLAASSLNDAPDAEEIRKQLGQIRKAFSQINRILSEGDF